MKTITLIKHGPSDSAFQEREHPKPSPGKEEVLIRVEAFGLNFADVTARLGLYRDAPPIPCVLGYEIVGTIEEVGEGIVETRVGERVTAFTRFGGYAEYCTTASFAAVDVDDMDAGKALALATQYVTAWYMAEMRAYLRKGDSVLVHSAAGGVGTALTQILKQKGCIIFGTTSQDSKCQYLLDNGVDHPINYKTHDYVKEIFDKNSGRIAASFNAVGGSSFKKDMKLIGAGGTVFTYGAASRTGQKGGFLATLKLLFSMGFTHPLFLLMKSKSIIAVNMLSIGDAQPAVLKECIEGVVQWAREGKLNPMVDSTYAASDIAQAHNRLESGDSMGKVCVKW